METQHIIHVWLMLYVCFNSVSAETDPHASLASVSDKVGMSLHIDYA